MDWTSSDCFKWLFSRSRYLIEKLILEIMSKRIEGKCTIATQYQKSCHLIVEE